MPDEIKEFDFLFEFLYNFTFVRKWRETRWHLQYKGSIMILLFVLLLWSDFFCITFFIMREYCYVIDLTWVINSMWNFTAIPPIQIMFFPFISKARSASKSHDKTKVLTNFKWQMSAGCCSILFLFYFLDWQAYANPWEIYDLQSKYALYNGLPIQSSNTLNIGTYSLKRPRTLNLKTRLVDRASKSGYWFKTTKALPNIPSTKLHTYTYCTKNYVKPLKTKRIPNNK
jgi:hypothetical protein